MNLIKEEYFRAYISELCQSWRRAMQHPAFTQHLFIQLHDGTWKDMGEICSADFGDVPETTVAIHCKQDESDVPSVAMDMPDKLLFGA